MGKIREREELRELERKRSNEEVYARKDWAEKVDSLQRMLMRRKYERDVENARIRKGKLQEVLRMQEEEKELEKMGRHSSRTSFSEFYHLEDADAAVKYVEVEP